MLFVIDTLNTWLDSPAGGDRDYTQERAKLTRLQAAKATLELEQQRGNLIPLDLVLGAWEGQIANCRAKLLALPSKVAAQAVGADYVEIEQLFKSVIYEALDELVGDGV